ncbi:hypothetical protein A2U01_0093787, partial [Trifolium medium]|nr:hypothetical protein [Trifolium medium]
MLMGRQLEKKTWVI